MADHKPGDRIEIAQTTGRATLTVGQAVDERKPLCSLFFNSDDNRSWSWAAWSPLGPFETSNENIEHEIGWHFNPQKPDAPATFDDIGKYRTEFFGNGLLPKLIEQGKVTDWPPTPRVKVSLQFDPETPAAELVRGGWKVGDKNLPLFVSVTAPDVDPEIVGVTLEVQGSGKTLELKRYDQAHDLWTESLRQLIARPGVVRLAARVTMSVAGGSAADGKPAARRTSPAKPGPRSCICRRLIPTSARHLSLPGNDSLDGAGDGHSHIELEPGDSPADRAPSPAGNSQSLGFRPGSNQLTLRRAEQPATAGIRVGRGDRAAVLHSFRSG